MKTSNRPNFKSPNLNQVLNEVHDIFDNHQADIDSVSDDIRSLEKYIREKNVQVSFNKSYKGSIQHVQYGLAWSKLEEESKEFRLICCTWLGNHNGEVKPLIEMPLSTRMEVYPHLDDFLKSLAVHIKIYNRNQKEFVDAEASTTKPS